MITYNKAKISISFDLPISDEEWGRLRLVQHIMFPSDNFQVSGKTELGIDIPSNISSPDGSDASDEADKLSSQLPLPA